MLQYNEMLNLAASTRKMSEQEGVERDGTRKSLIKMFSFEKVRLLYGQEHPDTIKVMSNLAITLITID